METLNNYCIWGDWRYLYEYVNAKNDQSTNTLQKDTHPPQINTI